MTARPVWLTVLLLGCCATLIVTFILLGNWQMRRLAWKTDLIETVESRAFGEPVDLPERFEPDAHSYLRVRAVGQFEMDKPVLIKAVTGLGPGYWLMMPLLAEGRIIWVNRGFVPAQAQDPAGWALPDLPVTGLLRPSEPAGTLLERNDPGAGRWVSRDVEALSEAVGLGETAPYFIDADHNADETAWPRGGLTQLSFRNTHLSYALTWYAMALLLFGAVAYLTISRLRR
ncbi:SURF1 family protein [Ruegeria sp. 2205SS24-7]|uniref:SURF1 family protein n=1 Tax=Ruegeria discodermiae TaxID=3064389 RepID=UPI0027419467|nr:SURF1 family protein [Ruegeria sp. 2205SS24-7]MDP5218075.1 SURF1 family protein [Ruegeria sp. 2205SS24-7]